MSKVFDILPELDFSGNTLIIRFTLNKKMKFNTRLIRRELWKALTGITWVLQG